MLFVVWIVRCCCVVHNNKTKYSEYCTHAAHFHRITLLRGSGHPIIPGAERPSRKGHSVLFYLRTTSCRDISSFVGQQHHHYTLRVTAHI